jgi:hypothetical protein
MKGFALLLIALLFWLFGVALESNTETTTIRTHHRLTPRMELIIDSGRVDTMYVYKAEGK